jgi:adenosylcobinamide kinase/adenosylcobinamide-phosphate guanylyltransferase
LSDKQKIILLLGGARSGKSNLAQKLAESTEGSVIFIATGEPLDSEMEARIVRHKKNRPEEWQTIEASRNVGRTIKEKIIDDDVVIIDCITLLVSNLLPDDSDYEMAEEVVLTEINELIAAMKERNGVFIIVSNEVGSGLVPDNRIGRIYRDMLGKANQLLAHNADEVYVLFSGISVKIKG